MKIHRKSRILRRTKHGFIDYTTNANKGYNYLGPHIKWFVSTRCERLIKFSWLSKDQIIHIGEGVNKYLDVIKLSSFAPYARNKF